LGERFNCRGKTERIKLWKPNFNDDDNHNIGGTDSKAIKKERRMKIANPREEALNKKMKTLNPPKREDYSIEYFEQSIIDTKAKGETK